MVEDAGRKKSERRGGPEGKNSPGHVSWLTVAVSTVRSPKRCTGKALGPYSLLKCRPHLPLVGHCSKQPQPLCSTSVCEQRLSPWPVTHYSPGGALRLSHCPGRQPCEHELIYIPCHDAFWGMRRCLVHICTYRDKSMLGKASPRNPRDARRLYASRDG